MDSTKTISLVIVIVSLFALWLDANQRLLPVLDAVSSAPASDYQGPSLTDFVIGVVVYLFILSLLSPRAGFLFTVILVLGGLLYNSETYGQTPSRNLLSILSNPIGNTTSPSAITGGQTGIYTDPSGGIWHVGPYSPSSG